MPEARNHPGAGQEVSGMADIAEDDRGKGCTHSSDSELKANLDSKGQKQGQSSVFKTISLNRTVIGGPA